MPTTPPQRQAMESGTLIEQWSTDLSSHLKRNSFHGTYIYRTFLYRPIWCYEILTRKMKTVGFTETIHLVAVKGPGLLWRRFK